MAQSPIVGQAGRYLLMTCVSAVMTLGIPALLHEAFGVGEEVSVAISLVAAFCINFLTTRFYVFSSGGPMGPQLARFTVVAAGFRVAEYVAFLVLHTWLGMMYLLALALVLIVSIVLKFFAYRRFVFD